MSFVKNVNFIFISNINVWHCFHSHISACLVGSRSHFSSPLMSLPSNTVFFIISKFFVFAIHFIFFYHFRYFFLLDVFTAPSIFLYFLRIILVDGRLWTKEFFQSCLDNDIFVIFVNNQFELKRWHEIILTQFWSWSFQ